MTITGLRPETTYAVRLSAVNGKGVGELSLPAEFKTQPVRKYSPASPSAPLPSPAISATHGSHLFCLTDLLHPLLSLCFWVGLGCVGNSKILFEGRRQRNCSVCTGWCFQFNLGVAEEEGVCEGEF